MKEIGICMRLHSTVSNGSLRYHAWLVSTGLFVRGIIGVVKSGLYHNTKHYGPGRCKFQVNKLEIGNKSAVAAASLSTADDGGPCGKI